MATAYAKKTQIPLESWILNLIIKAQTIPCMPANTKVSALTLIGSEAG